MLMVSKLVAAWADQRDQYRHVRHEAAVAGVSH